MMAKVMHFFGNTKLFCHFLLADIEKVLYIYMPFYDGMGTYFLGKWCSGVEKTKKNTVVLLVSNLIFIYLQLLS
ncbi:hypothetical protein PREVCOP_05320 [Segatella copri DSM 18205]|uniref:Uncharacterized protein n=1 Tax=Segatella copri DSM 18205 TaxID=537011 RepID=D1PDN0_9BACT|nr:hypothetical protein PREVCOP_05320 [Segatella copri DSM 18205]